MNTDDRALLLARRQKRLRHWQQLFSEKSLEESARSEIQGHLNQYRDLITKIAKSESDDDLRALRADIDSLERQISARFDSRRLATSQIGAAVATSTSERGDPGPGE